MRGLRVWVLAIGFLILGCTVSENHAKGVYLLFSPNSADSQELKPVRAIVYYLLATLEPTDSLAVARTDSPSFNDKDIIAQITFDTRPSRANYQKRAFKEKIDGYASLASGRPHEDISGAILQAVEYLNTAGCESKYILIVSDLKVEPANSYPTDVPSQLSGFTIIWHNPTQAGRQTGGPESYRRRIEAWRDRIERANGRWRVIEDIAELSAVIDK